MSIDPAALLALIPDDDFLADAKVRGFVLVRRIEKACLYCGEPFVPKSGRQAYCCLQHRRRAAMRDGTRIPEGRTWAERHPEAYNAYHRAYQRKYQEQMTPEQRARKSQQQRESYHRRLGQQEGAA